MAKLRNKKTKVVKEIKKDFEASMYLATGEWELVQDKEEPKAKTPIINTKSEE